jgi:hypothetical protein
LELTLLLFTVQVCIDEDVSEITEPDAGTMLKSGFIGLFVLLFLGVSLKSFAVNDDLER